MMILRRSRVPRPWVRYAVEGAALVGGVVSLYALVIGAAFRWMR